MFCGIQHTLSAAIAYGQSQKIIVLNATYTTHSFYPLTSPVVSVGKPLSDIWFEETPQIKGDLPSNVVI